MKARAFSYFRAATIDQALDAFRPDVVINPAAYTAVDKAEAEPKLAFAINRDGAGAVAAAAAAQNAPVIHFLYCLVGLAAMSLSLTSCVPRH